MIPKAPFGRTGHVSSRLVFGAAALWQATTAEADAAFDMLREAGVNHLDVAASYGDAELRVGAWMARHRGDFFLATKTGERSYAGARDQIEQSRQRLQSDCIDLIQFHNLVNPEEWETLFGAEGALKAALEARDAGHVRFIGVTGHGTRVAQMHLRSLARFDFDSVLLPYNPSSMASPEYAAEFEALYQACGERGIAMQTIKAIARRRWPDGVERNRNCWYQPLESADAIERAIHWALARDGVFVNTASDLDLLPHALRAAERFEVAPSRSAILADRDALAIEPLFIRGYEGARTL